MSKESKRHSRKQDIVAGAITGVTSRFLVAPLDNLYRMQVQYGHYGKCVYPTIGTVVKQIFQKEGLAYFWNGNMAAEYMWCLYSSVQFTVVNFIRDLNIFSNRSLNIFYGGCLSGICSTLISYPLDLARTRMAAQNAHNTYDGVWKLLASVYKESRIKGLYTGLLPTLIQISPYTAINFTLYDYFVCHSKFENSLMSSFNGFLSGSTAKIIVYPLDTIKKQMQTRTMFTKSKSTFQILSLMYSKGGISSFYAGLLPSLLKSGLSTSLYFGIYAYLSKSFIKYNLF